jgi:hypothetical protein
MGDQRQPIPVKAPVTAGFSLIEVDSNLFLHDDHHDAFYLLVIIYIVEADHGDESWS